MMVAVEEQQQPAVEEKQKTALESGTPWGSIKEVLNAPLIDVPADASWLSVVLMWLTLPLNLLQGIFCGLIPCLFVSISIGCCCRCGMYFSSAMGSVLRGRPFYLAWTWWRYVLAGLTALIANGQSRLSLFIWEWKAFGSGDWWWHGEGVWCWSYKDVERILKSQQMRKSAFGAINACVPDLFATNILIFLPNEGTESQWHSLRAALHQHFLNPDGDDFMERVGKLREKLSADWKSPQLSQLNDVGLLQKSVAKCVMYVMFGVWIEDGEAETLIGWRTNAMMFILPRLVHRFLFNFGINKVKALRQNTVGIIEKRGLQSTFEQMNSSLPPKWRRPTVVKLCDEIMYIIGFAGIGGTCAAVESCAAFLQTKIPKESAAEHIKWGEFDTPEKMRNKYVEAPEKYIRETLRLDPPVTSATGVLKQVTKVMLAGKEFCLKPGLLNQYVLSMANRDPAVFENPEIFEPERDNLKSALTWNGAFGADNEQDFPRICPGRQLSMYVTKAVLDHVLNASAPEQPSRSI